MALKVELKPHERIIIGACVVTNTDQRLLELVFKIVNDETLEVQGPPTAAHMPRGYCLLFVLNRDGVPSVAKFVKVV